MTGVGEVVDPVLAIALGVGTSVDQLGSEPAGARRRGEHEVQRRVALGLEHLARAASWLELELAPIGIGHAPERLIGPQAADRVGVAAKAGYLDVQRQ